MDWNDADQLRSYIIMAEAMSGSRQHEERIEVKSEVVFDAELRRDLHDLVDRLRSIMESSGGDYSLGYETGLQRAAEMIENVLRRHEEKNGSQIL